MGNSQMRHLFLPALTLLRPVELPAHRKALLLACYCFPSLTEIALHSRNRTAVYTSPAQHTWPVKCICVSQNKGKVLGFSFFKQVVWTGVKPSQNCPDVQFLIQGQIAPKLLLLGNCKIKNLHSVSCQLTKL